MKTQIITFKKEHCHFIWRLLLLCIVIINSLLSAQVCIGNTSQFVTKKNVDIEFSSVENDACLQFIYSQKNTITSSRENINEKIKTYWIKSEFPAAEVILFKFSMTEKEYFFGNCIDSVHPFNIHYSDTKFKAFVLFFSDQSIRSIHLNTAFLKSNRSFETIDVKSPLVLPRPPPLV